MGAADAAAGFGAAGAGVAAGATGAAAGAAGAAAGAALAVPAPPSALSMVSKMGHHEGSTRFLSFW